MTSDFKYTFRKGDPDKPAFLLLHGTGGDEDDLIPLADAIVPGATILSPRGQVSENGAPRFFRRFAEGVLDLNDWKQRTFELADFIEKRVAEEGLPVGNLIAMGYSNGANIAQGLLLRRPDLLQGAILLRPMFVKEPKVLPEANGKPVLLLPGERDPLMPQGDPQKLIDLFRKCGFHVTCNSMPGGHGLTQEDITIAREWLA